MTTTGQLVDRYPSRVAAEPEILQRQDPVVWGSAADGPLDQGQLEHFTRDGVLMLQGVLDADEVQDLLAAAAELASSSRLRASERTITEPTSDQVRSVFEVHRLSETIGALASDDRLAGAARQILGSDVYIHQSRVNFKPAIHGEGFFWHSDFETWHTEDGMPAMRAISFSVALTENFHYNGPLMVLPGSHNTYVACVGETPDDHYKHSLRSQQIGTPDDASLHILAEQATGEIATQVGPAGSVAIFDCNAMHGSNSNISPFPRSNVFLVFNSVDNALVEPFSATSPRPSFIAARDFTPTS